MVAVNNKRMLLLSVFSVLLLVLLIIYIAEISSITSLTNTFYQQFTIESNLTEVESSPSENVICYLVASYTGEPGVAFDPYPNLRERIVQLDERFDDGYDTDIIIFHTGYPFRRDFLSIIESSRRHIEFVNIDDIFYKFAPGFEPYIRDPNWSKNGKWNYHHMCNFWFKQVFELKIIQKYRYIMRLDHDSQIQGKWPNVFNLMSQHQAVYMANQRGIDYHNGVPGKIGLVRDVILAHVMKNNITAQNPDMYADIFHNPMQVPSYSNNFEVVHLSFIRRKDVLDFTKAVDESQGIFLYRWGDANLRYITLALFANATQILHRIKLGLQYCHPC